MKKNKTLITYILFSYNQEEYISDAVTSALEQDYESMQIILSDDCSTDNTFEIMQKLVDNYTGSHEILLNKNKKNLGLAQHINKAINLSNGEIIVFAAGDDVAMLNKTKLLISPMLSNPDIVGVHSAVDEINRVGKFIQKRHLYWKNFDSLESIIDKGISVSSQAHAFRKKVFEKFGPLDAYVTNEGKVLAFREAALGKIISLNESTIQYRSDVGISSPTIGDVNKITRTDPIKYCNWYLSTLKQIEKDNKRLNNSKRLNNLIKNKIIYYDLLNNILNKPWNLVALYESFFLNASYRKNIFKAFLRRNSPYYIRKIFVVLKEKQSKK